MISAREILGENPPRGAGELKWWRGRWGLGHEGHGCPGGWWDLISRCVCHCPALTG